MACTQIWFKERHSKLYEDTLKVKNTKIEKYEDKFLIYTDEHVHITEVLKQGLL